MSLDTLLFRFVNGAYANPVFDAVMPALTVLGDGKFLLVTAVLIMVFASGSRKMPGLLLALGLAASRFVVYFLKGVFSRPRPFVVEPEARLLIAELDKLHSFPSGHATISFMAAVILARYFRFGYVFFSLAALVALSRVYIGVHYPFDVISGAGLGCLMGYILVRCADKIGRSSQLDKK